MAAIEDILDWSSTKLSAWKQDALRRLACQTSLTKTDYSDILHIIKSSVGFSILPKPADPIPLEKAHFASAAGGGPLRIKAVRGVENVNRLVPSATLPFAPELSPIFGDGRVDQAAAVAG
jgi:hypothetical protein